MKKEMSKLDVEAWVGTINTSIRIRKGELKKYRESASKINYNTAIGQKKSKYHEKKIAELEAQLKCYYEELSEAKAELRKHEFKEKIR